MRTETIIKGGELDEGTKKQLLQQSAGCTVEMVNESNRWVGLMFVQGEVLLCFFTAVIGEDTEEVKRSLENPIKAIGLYTTGKTAFQPIISSEKKDAFGSDREQDIVNRIIDPNDTPTDDEILSVGKGVTILCASLIGEYEEMANHFEEQETEEAEN